MRPASLFSSAKIDQSINADRHTVATLQLITDDVDICVDCYADHHEGRQMKDSSAVTWTDNTDSDSGDGITDFSSARCGCCHSTLAGARYRMAVWEA